MGMFCYQCQEASQGVACTGLKGVCGIESEVVNLQDLMVYMFKGISYYAVKAKEKGVDDVMVDRFVITGLFQTITNANFDKQVFVRQILDLKLL